MDYVLSVMNTSENKHQHITTTRTAKPFISKLIQPRMSTYSQKLKSLYNFRYEFLKKNFFQICPSGVTDLFVTGTSVFSIHREEFLLGGHDRSVSAQCSLRYGCQ
jgi:hypothetical protein